MQTKHWSSCPLCLTHALPQADHGHGPAVPRGAAFPWGGKDMGSLWHLLLFLRGHHELFLAPVSREQLKHMSGGHTLSPSFPVQQKCQPSSPLPQQLPQGFHDHSLFMHLFSRETGSRVNQTLLSAQWLREMVCFGTCVCGCSLDSMTLPDLCKTRSAESSPLFLSHPIQQFIAILLSSYPEFTKTKFISPVDIT